MTGAIDPKKLTRGHLEILKEALSAPGRQFTARQVAIDFGVTEDTARRYLNQLAETHLSLVTR